MHGVARVLNSTVAPHTAIVGLEQTSVQMDESHAPCHHNNVSEMPEELGLSAECNTLPVCQESTVNQKVTKLLRRRDHYLHAARLRQYDALVWPGLREGLAYLGKDIVAISADSSLIYFLWNLLAMLVSCKLVTKSHFAYIPTHKDNVSFL